MLKSELLEIIANGENSGIEFKRDDMRSEHLAKEVVAFANLQGGRILIGVEDDGTISGICQRTHDTLEEWVMNVIREKVHPMIIPYYEEVLIEEGKRIAIISVIQGISKPYVMRHAGGEEIYIRSGSTSQKASREQQARLYDAGGMLHIEKMPVPGTSMTSLDMGRLENYLHNIISDPQVPQTGNQWQERLIGLGFLVKTPNDNVVCTVAGLVLFGISPRHSLRQSGIRVMVFEGEDKTYRSFLDEILDGPIVGRFKGEGAGNKQIIDEGLIEKLSTMLRPFLSQESETITDNMQRYKTWFYPWDAVRETVVNAIAHRDWSRFVDIEVACYSNRIEVISPGSLHNSMTIDKMKAGQRSPRNQIIVDVLRDYGYVDARGMGIRVKVIPLMVKENHREPVFEVTEDYLKVTLYRR
jgi:ATP-dependent DNA helicase RecG